MKNQETQDMSSGVAHMVESNKRAALLEMVYSTITSIKDAQNSVLYDSDNKQEHKAKAQSKIWMTAMAFVIYTGDAVMKGEVIEAFNNVTNAQANAAISPLAIIKEIFSDTDWDF